MGKMFEERGYVAVGSLGDYDACVLDYYRLTDAVNAFNQGEERLSCARDLFEDPAELEEVYGFSDELMERFDAITGKVYPFLRVRFHFPPDKLSAGVVDDIAARFNLRQYHAGRGVDNLGDMFDGRFHPTPDGVQNHPQLRVLRAEMHDIARSALTQSPTFRPFGAQLGTDGQIQLISIDDTQLTDDQQAEAIWRGHQKTAEAGQLVSAAVVRVGAAGNRNLELTICLEHRLGMALAVVNSVEGLAGPQIFVDSRPTRVETQPMRVFVAANDQGRSDQDPEVRSGDGGPAVIEAAEAEGDAPAGG